jgi:lipopolysaccharide transport system permease protein
MTLLQRGSAAALEASTTVIKPTRGPLPPRLRELWSHRELFAFLVWRDVKVRYAQTVLGSIWTIFQPLALMGVYTFAFTQIGKLSTPGTPYVLYALSGLALWIFVSRGILTGSDSLVANIPLVTKTSCPRLLIPLAAVVSAFVDFLISLVLFLIFSIAYGRYPTWRFVFVPAFLLAAFALAFGLSLFLSALNVKYRDVGQALPFIVQLWFFLSPVAYVLPTNGVTWKTVVLAVNPLTGLITGFRWSLLATPPPHGVLVAALIFVGVALIVGMLFFSRADRTLADDV